MKPHKHAELIKKWADGAEIQFFDEQERDWIDFDSPSWANGTKYRIKPEPKPDVMQFYRIDVDSNDFAVTTSRLSDDNLCLTFDGETGKLKAAEVLK